MTASYLTQLDEELTEAGIRGRLKQRIVTEFADHLESDPNADLGRPADLARQFADELGTARARTAALTAFAALALAGLLLGVTFLAGGGLSSMIARDEPTPPMLGLLGCMLAGQVSVVSGGLGVLRALRTRRAPVISTAEARCLARRAGVALAAGAITMAALPILALSQPHAFSSAWKTAAYIATAVGLVAIAAAAPAGRAAARVRPQQPGDAADLLSDLAPVVPRSLSPWQFALATAAALVIVTAAAGAIGNDPYDGALRGLLEGGACLAGFATLGRYLGLRA